MTSGSFRYALYAYLDLFLLGCSPSTLQLCPVRHTRVDTLDRPRLSSCRTFPSMFTRRYTSLNRTIVTALHRAGYRVTPKITGATSIAHNSGEYKRWSTFRPFGLRERRVSGLLCGCGNHLAHIITTTHRNQLFYPRYHARGGLRYVARAVAYGSEPASGSPITPR